jgi:hypothetical protein
MSIVWHAEAEARLWSKRFLGLVYASIQLGVINASLVKKLHNANLASSSADGDVSKKGTTARDDLAALRMLHEQGQRAYMMSSGFQKGHVT